MEQRKQSVELLSDLRRSQKRIADLEANLEEARLREEKYRQLLDDAREEISALRCTEEKLREAERRFRTFFDYAPIGKCMTAPNGRLTYVNPTFASMLGYSMEELNSLSFPDITHPDDLAKSMECVRRLLEEELDFWSMDKRYRTQDGQWLWTHVTTRLLRDSEGTPLHFLTHIQDISEKKRAEELDRRTKDLERSNRDLEQFAYVASHDLQEPLRMIASFTQLLAKKYENQLDDRARKYIQYSVDGANRLQRLIQDLLLYSRVGSKGRPPEPVDSHAILDQAIGNLAASIEESQAVITSDDLPVVAADDIQLLQLFQNLLANSIKFRRDIAPLIHVSAQDQGHQWLFSVQDNGIGIEACHTERVFDIFQRLHGRNDYAGTGIGLALCKRIVERHGGQTWFEAEPGKGSTLFFILPK